MKILIIGGTQMLGRNFVEHLIKIGGHDIFVANRGVTNPSLFLENSKFIKINRNCADECINLSANNYDIVVDFSCYTVEQFKNTYKYLKYDKYIYISTVSVHEKNIINNPDLNNSYHKYCVDKYLIEKFIFENNVKNYLIVRPCAIYGENDYTNRFYKKDGEYYWKSNNSKASNNAMLVDDFTKILLNYINSCPEISVVDLTKNRLN